VIHKVTPGNPRTGCPNRNIGTGKKKIKNTLREEITKKPARIIRGSGQSGLVATTSSAGKPEASKEAAVGLPNCAARDFLLKRMSHQMPMARGNP
jgi:hypothetical protein